MLYYPFRYTYLRFVNLAKTKLFTYFTRNIREFEDKLYGANFFSIYERGKTFSMVNCKSNLIQTTLAGNLYSNVDNFRFARYFADYRSTYNL